MISKEARREYNRKYKEKNKEKLRLKAKEYYWKNREKLNLDSQTRYRLNRLAVCKKLRNEYEDRAEYLLAYNKASRIALRKQVLTLLGGICVCCKENEHEFLEVDHIRGGGNAHFKSAGTWGVLREIRDDPDRLKKYRILCSNCNKAISKRGCCPHSNGITGVVLGNRNKSLKRKQLSFDIEPIISDEEHAIWHQLIEEEIEALGK